MSDVTDAPPATELIVVGVDGGGTSTRVLVADERGKVLHRLQGDASAVKPGAEAESADVIAALVKDAVIAADMGHLMPRALVVGVAGVGREAQKIALQQELERHELAESITVLSDAEAAMEDAFADGPGILLIGGTGSIAWGRSPVGTMQRCGGWGPLIGDEGGGAWLGRKALQVITAAHDGREPETALTGAILTALELDDVPSIIAWAAAATPGDMATLAPAVLSAAAVGDLRANTIVTMAVEELGLHIRALARALFVDERAAIPVALHGGLLAKGRPMRKLLEHRLKTLVPGAAVRHQPVDAAHGAVQMALRTIGLTIGPA
jgi:glucosamine kinase